MIQLKQPFLTNWMFQVPGNLYPPGNLHLPLMFGMFEDEFPFPVRWDMLVSWRVLYNHSIFQWHFLEDIFAFTLGAPPPKTNRKKRWWNGP